MPFMLTGNTPVVTIDASQIYYCNGVVASEITESDWALVKLDRVVSDHVPLSIRTEGKVADGEDLVVIGHPVGLPRKYAGGATVQDNSESVYFQANLDTYGGNSGSAVVNANTYVVEGILDRGNPDFVQDGACDRSSVCPDSGCPGWEEATRTTEFSSLVPVPVYDVYFDTNDPPTELVCSDSNVPSCEGHLSVASLDPCRRYYWQVVTKEDCGQTAGPVWSFTTVSVAGDYDVDCDVDFIDLAKLCLYWLENESSVNLAPPPEIIDFVDFARFAENWGLLIEY